MKRTLTLAAALMLSATATFAAVTAQSLADDFAAQGYTKIEIRTGATQIRVEAIRGAEKVEILYDIESGTVISREDGTASTRDQNSTGVSIRDGQTETSGHDDDDNDDDSNDDNDDDSNDDDSNDDDSNDDDDNDDDSNDDDSNDD